MLPTSANANAAQTQLGRPAPELEHITAQDPAHQQDDAKGKDHDSLRQ
jgi:hypothetical protein